MVSLQHQNTAYELTATHDTATIGSAHQRNPNPHCNVHTASPGHTGSKEAAAHIKTIFQATRATGQTGEVTECILLVGSLTGTLSGHTPNWRIVCHIAIRFCWLSTARRLVISWKLIFFLALDAMPFKMSYRVQL